MFFVKKRASSAFFASCALVTFNWVRLSTKSDIASIGMRRVGFDNIVFEPLDVSSSEWKELNICDVEVLLIGGRCGSVAIGGIVYPESIRTITQFLRDSKSVHRWAVAGLYLGESAGHALKKPPLGNASPVFIVTNRVAGQR